MTTVLEPQILDNLSMDPAQKVLDEMCLDTEKKYDAHQFWYRDPTEQISSNLRSLLDVSSQIFTQNGFLIDSNKWFVEGHRYSTENKPVSSPLTWHVDDNGGWPEKVSTLLFYLKKDPTLEGGDLLWSLVDPEPIDPLVRLANSFGFFKQPEIHRIPIRNGISVLMRGDLYHTPEDITGGSGRREVIVVQFARLN